MENITLATACWQQDYDVILDSSYSDIMFRKEFDKRILIVNNVKKENELRLMNMLSSAKNKNIITDYYYSESLKKEVLSFWFNGKYRNNLFVRHANIHNIVYSIKNKQKIKFSTNGYWYSIAPLSAIYLCETDYLLCNRQNKQIWV